MIIAVVGPVGSGKDLISDILSSEYGFGKVSLGDSLREELIENGIELTRENLQNEGDKVRKEKGADYLARKVSKNLQREKNYVFTSIRNPAEIEFLKSIFEEMIVLINVLYFDFFYQPYSSW